MTGTPDRREESTSVRRQRLTGVVASAGKMAQTISVTVERFPWHQGVGKQIRRTRSLLVHDPKNQAAVGDRVVIEATRPLSKRKHFRVVSIERRNEKGTLRMTGQETGPPSGGGPVSADEHEQG